MMPSELRYIPPDAIRVNEAFWGPGSEPTVLGWLAAEYDPDTMPTLALAQINGREGLWLLGWENGGTEYPPLLEMIFGPGYAVARLDQVQAEIVRERMITPGEDEGIFGFGH
jgi:hypothetical protein